MARYDRPKADVTIANPRREVEPAIVVGMVAMTIAMLTAPGMDTIAKYLGTTGNVASGIVAFGRFMVQAVVLFFLLSVLIRLGKISGLWPSNIPGNLLRGGLMGTAAFLFFTGVTSMPVADAIAIFFVEPFILTILSMIFLGEKVGWRRGMAVVVGFAGALLIIQPSFEKFGAVALLPVATAFIFAVYLLITRKIASNDEPLAMQFAAGVGGTVTLGLILLVGGQGFGLEVLEQRWPTTEEFWFLLVLLGLLGTGSHLLIVFAFARAPASILAPFQYVEIVSATILGYVVFGDFPNAIKWLGIAIIVGSGIYIFLREARLSKQETES